MWFRRVHAAPSRNSLKQLHIFLSSSNCPLHWPSLRKSYVRFQPLLTMSLPMQTQEYILSFESRSLHNPNPLCFQLFKVLQPLQQPCKVEDSCIHSRTVWFPWFQRRPKLNEFRWWLSSNRAFAAPCLSNMKLLHKFTQAQGKACK